jgi:hypothetical protein
LTGLVNLFRDQAGVHVSGMGSHASERAELKARIAVLREIERAAAAADKPNILTLAAIRDLLMEAEAELGR